MRSLCVIFLLSLAREVEDGVLMDDGDDRHHSPRPAATASTARAGNRVDVRRGCCSVSSLSLIHSSLPPS
jgi:hypothetical protein